MMAGVRCAKRVGLAAVIALSSLASACGPKDLHGGATQIERGERVEVGSVVYDEYFGAVHQLHSELIAMRLEEGLARSALAEAIGLLPDASKDQIVDRIRRTRSSWPALQLVIEEPDETGAKSSLRAGSTSDERGDEVMRGLDTTCSALLRLAIKLGPFAERARRIRNIGAALSNGVDKDLVKLSLEDRKRVRSELKAAEAILLQIAQASERDARAHRAFVRSIKEALEGKVEGKQK